MKISVQLLNTQSTIAAPNDPYSFLLPGDSQIKAFEISTLEFELFYLEFDFCHLEFEPYYLGFEVGDLEFLF